MPPRVERNPDTELVGPLVVYPHGTARPVSDARAPGVDLDDPDSPPESTRRGYQGFREGASDHADNQGATGSGGGV